MLLLFIIRCIDNVSCSRCLLLDMFAFHLYIEVSKSRVVNGAIVKTPSEVILLGSYYIKLRFLFADVIIRS